MENIPVHGSRQYYGYLQGTFQSRLIGRDSSEEIHLVIIYMICQFFYNCYGIAVVPKYVHFICTENSRLIFIDN